MPTNIAEAISAYRNMQRESGLGGLSALAPVGGATHGNARLQVSWNHAERTKGYRLQWKNAADETFEAYEDIRVGCPAAQLAELGYCPVYSTQYSLEGLEANTLYDVRVTALIGLGPSPNARLIEGATSTVRA